MKKYNICLNTKIIDEEGNLIECISDTFYINIDKYIVIKKEIENILGE